MATKTPEKIVTRPLSAEEAAYIAGFVDGEGSIFFILEPRKANRSGFRISPRFEVAQVKPEVLHWIIDRCGGRLGFEDRSKKAGNCQDCWKVQWKPNAIRWVLRQIRPYLIVKARAADLMLEFLSLTTAQANYGKYSGERQWEIYQLVKAENKRGRGDYEPVEIPDSVENPRPHIPSKTAGKCSVDGCEKVHYAHGLCRRHYRGEYVNKTESFPTHCQQCGSELVEPRADQKYCGHKCNMKAYRRRKRRATILVKE